MPPPFRQGRFEDLPERPRLAHRYWDGETATIMVHSAPLGPIATHVVSYGPPDAPPLLLIHGLMTTSYSWRYMFEPLGTVDLREVRAVLQPVKLGVRQQLAQTLAVVR